MRLLLLLMLLSLLLVACSGYKPVATCSLQGSYQNQYCQLKRFENKK